jgi:hypothetical protein
MVLHNCPDASRFLAGCSRLLRPGGLIIVTITDPYAYLVKQGVSHHPYERQACFQFPMKLAGKPSHTTTVPYFHRPLASYLSGFDGGVVLTPSTAEPLTIGSGRRHDTWLLLGRH